MTTTVYHRKDFKTKPVMKREYKELVKFCDDLLIDEDKKNKEINELKKQNLKLIQAVDILNQSVKSISDEKNATIKQLLPLVEQSCCDDDKHIYCSDCDSCLVCASDNCDCYDDKYPSSPVSPSEQEESYREGRKNFMEDMVSEFPEMEDKILKIY